MSQTFSTVPLNAGGPNRKNPDAESLRRLQPLHRHILLAEQLGRDLKVITDDNGTVTIKDTESKSRVKLTAPDLDDKAFQDIQNRRWLRAERTSEIIEQQTDILSFLALAYPMTRDTHPFTMAILDAVLSAAGKLVVQAKHHLNVTRPADLNGGIAPVIRTPAHGATPSGHATESWAMAFVMESMIFGGVSQELRLIAARIEENRMVAGVHYAHDGYMGRKLAAFLAPIFAERLGLVNPALEATRNHKDMWDGPGQAGLKAAAKPGCNDDPFGTPHRAPSQPSYGGADDVLGHAMEMSRAELGFGAPMQEAAE
jgi:hypothetical protein